MLCLGRRGFGECGLGLLQLLLLCSLSGGLILVLLANLWCSFFYADQREADGGPVWSEPDAEGHARFYLSLVEDDEVPYYATFLDGKYKEFP